MRSTNATATMPQIKKRAFITRSMAFRAFFPVMGSFFLSAVPTSAPSMAAFTACPAISCSIRFSFVPGQGVRPDFSGTAAAPVVGTAADRIYEGGKQALSYWATGTAPALAIRSLAAVEVAKSKKAWAASDRASSVRVANTKGR